MPNVRYTRDDLLSAAWESFQAAKRVRAQRDAVVANHETFIASRKSHEQLVTEHMKAQQRVREIEEALVNQQTAPQVVAA